MFIVLCLYMINVYESFHSRIKKVKQLKAMKSLLKSNENASKL